MSGTVERIISVSAACLLFVAPVANAQIQNLRISEVNPVTGLVEVTNTGPLFTTTTTYPFCHRFNYFSTVTSGLLFPPGGFNVIAVLGLSSTDTDLWLYRDGNFPSALSIIHGLKYGPQSNVGRTGLAASVGLWPSASAYVNKPPAGMTLSWDGFGFDPLDWYIDETPSLGAADVTAPGTVAQGLAYPTGAQGFEVTKLGDEVIAIENWSVVDASANPGMFTIRTVNDVQGTIAPRGGSTKWLRIRDQDSGAVQSQLYTPTITAPLAANYTWTFWINLEQKPPGGSNTRPRITLQHPDPVYKDAWGIRFNPNKAALVVFGYGGPAGSTDLYDISGATDIGEWVKIDVSVSFDSDMLVASVNDGTPVSLPIDLDAAADKTRFRFCYLGQGSGNVMTMLLDDVSVSVDDQVPVAFQNVEASARGSSVDLRWEVYADEAMTGFQVYRREAGGDLEVAVTPGLLPPTAREFTDDGAEYGKRYHYVVAAELPDGSTIRSAAATVEIAPLVTSLRQNFPNPFNPATTIGYTLSNAGEVNLDVFDVKGRRVARVASGLRDAGPHTASWDGRDDNGNLASTGIYFYKLRAGNQVLTRKMVLLR